MKGVVLEKNLKVNEAKEIILGVFDEIEQDKILNQFLMETLQRSVSRMIHRDEFLARF